MRTILLFFEGIVLFDIFWGAAFERRPKFFARPARNFFGKILKNSCFPLARFYKTML